jgi:hypothetical protein
MSVVHALTGHDSCHSSPWALLRRYMTEGKDGDVLFWAAMGVMQFFMLDPPQVTVAAERGPSIFAVV